MERIESLLRELTQDEVEEVREAAAEALNRFLARKKFSGFMGTLASGSLEERMRVVYAAEEMGGEEGMKLLLKALEDESEEVRGAAVRMLEAFLTTEVLKALVGRLAKEKGIILANMVSALGKSRRKELIPILLKFINNPDPQVQANVVEALGEVGAVEAVPKILEKAESPSATVRRAVAKALGAIPLRH